MFEKVNPQHPDKVADRIAGAIVDFAYILDSNPRVAVEVLLGHNKCHIIAESSVFIPKHYVDDVVTRIIGSDVEVDYVRVPQDQHLAENQEYGLTCGDNGIFKGVPVSTEEFILSEIAHDIYSKFPTDGKYILDGPRLIICQSNATNNELFEMYPHAEINPLGYWTGGFNVDCGATNRKLGSDMGQSVTGGGLHGKDLSKADVSVNIFAWLEAQKTGKVVEYSCAIGDTMVRGIPYYKIVEVAREYIEKIGGFEKFAEWGLI